VLCYTFLYLLTTLTYICGINMVQQITSTSALHINVSPIFFFIAKYHILIIIALIMQKLPYIYCIYILHLGAFNIENAPRPNLRTRSTWSEPTAPPRPYRRFVFVPPARSRQNLFTLDSSLQLEDTPSCNQQATNVATGATTETQVCN
jgi:hypothetical protein